MKEKHIQVGDVKRFLHSIQRVLKKKKLIKKEDDGSVASLYGMKIIKNDYIPKNIALMVGENGNVIQIFNI